MKETVRIAQSNNLMGVVCTSHLLKMAPALIESIKVAGLVLVMDTTDDREAASNMPPGGVDGMLGAPSLGLLRFNESVDI